MQSGAAGALGTAQRGWMIGSTCFVWALFTPLVALIGSARRLLLAIAVLDIPLQIDTNLNHLEGPTELGGLGGFNVSLTTIALVGLYAGWLIEVVTRRESPSSSSFRPVLPLSLYLAFAILSVVTAYDPGLAVRELFLLLQMFLLFVYVVGRVRTWPDARFAITMILAGLLLEGLIMIWMLATGSGFEVAGMSGRVDVDEATDAARFGGTVGSPNNAAAYLAMLLAPAASILLTNLGRAYKVLAGLALLLGSVALIATQSRGGWLAAALSLAVVCVSMWWRGRLSLGRPLLVVGLVAGVSVAFQDSITARLTGDDRGSARSRLPLMAMAWEIISEHPLLGVGANNYSAALERDGSTLPGPWLFAVHNKLLLVWAEIGIGGLVAYLWFLVATIRRGWRRWKQFDPYVAPLAVGLTAGLIGHLVHMQVETFNGRPQIQLLFLVAALIVVLSRIDTTRTSRA